MDRAGRYLLTHRIGAGAFATVWQGVDPQLDVPVAVKVLADNWNHNSDIRERFLAEARLLRRISDPRVVRVFDIGETDDGRPYFVMDLLDGGTVQDLVDAAHDGALDAEVALRVAHETALGVQAVHDAGVVHRDIKPSNVLLTHDRTGVRIVDLGMAKELAEASGLTMTAGTPAYMAPEIADGTTGFDVRADVFSLGALTYAVLTGHPPFDVSGGIGSVVARDRLAAPRPVATRLGLAPKLDALLASALAHDPAARPRTAAAFARQLSGIDSSLTLTAPPREADVPPRRENAPAHRENSWGTGALVGLGVGAFVVFTLATWLTLTLLG